MVAVAKAKVGQASRLAVQEGLQMHGGIGMTDEHDIGLYLKRQRVLDEMFGDRSEEHTSELQSLMRISSAVFCLKKKKKETWRTATHSAFKPGHKNHVRREAQPCTGSTTYTNTHR